ncbi:DUF4082 domain-containing protein [Rhodococcus aetherivorans]|uniref:DUF4082 domain-containing protein n=2 Tax=Rhodococcus aetherivorans TaxID=191292 RepID=UPI00294A333D|nr:DUF4082 domain-containing protein [Rhodococcus aetherivorans]MDV6295434.1 DUF4082 domain-containing protein [Rhodococcus aetherivorans]
MPNRLRRRRPDRILTCRSHGGAVPCNTAAISNSPASREFGLDHCDSAQSGPRIRGRGTVPRTRVANPSATVAPPTGDGRAHRAIAAAAICIVALLGMSCTSEPAPSPSPQTPESIWRDDVVPPEEVGADAESVEMGTRFSASSNGRITAVRFFREPGSDIDTVSIWSTDGARLATAPVTELRDGWQAVPLPSPVRVVIGMDYVVSYHVAEGPFPTAQHTFTEGRVVEHGWLTARRGVFTDGSGFPDEDGKGASYFADVVFEPAGPSLRPVDGGEEFYGSFTNSLPATPDFFPIGVWFAGVLSAEEIATDSSIGINTYVELTDDSDVELIADNGMFAIPSWGADHIAGRLTTDEADMWAGPGSAAWTGSTPPAVQPVCVPADAKCGFTVMHTLRNQVPPGIMVYANYGRGVTFWQSREDSARFVSEFQDVVSADNYWFTDGNICGESEGGALRTSGERALSDAECRLAANYGLTVRHVRSLVYPAGSKPVWAFVEVGHPTTSATDPSITGPQVRAAVWSSIINGARGIVYFNHSFGGPCITANVLRGTCGDSVRDDVTRVNEQIRRLAPVLNAPFVDGLARSDSPVDVAVKSYDDDLYILAGATQADPFQARIEVACAGDSTAEVLDEDRRVEVVDGVLTDDFADGNAYHLYRITADGSCGLD